MQELKDRHLPAVERLAVVADHAVNSALVDEPLADEPLCIDSPRGLDFPDPAIHAGLGDHRLVGLVMALAAVTDQVDDHVVVKAVAVIERESCHEDHRVRVVGIDVEDRRLDQLGNLGAVERRTRLQGHAGGEADLVVHDQVHSATRVIAVGFREIQRLGCDALPDKCSIAVYENRHDLFPAVLSDAILARSHTTLDNRRDYLEMRGVESESDMDRPSRRLDVGIEALVVLHVP